MPGNSGKGESMVGGLAEAFVLLKLATGGVVVKVDDGGKFTGYKTKAACVSVQEKKPKNEKWVCAPVTQD